MPRGTCPSCVCLCGQASGQVTGDGGRLMRGQDPPAGPTAGLTRLGIGVGRQVVTDPQPCPVIFFAVRPALWPLRWANRTA